MSDIFFQYSQPRHHYEKLLLCEGMEAGGSSSCCCEIYLAVAVVLGLSVLYYTKLVDVVPIHFYVEMPIIF